MTKSLQELSDINDALEMLMTSAGYYADQVWQPEIRAYIAQHMPEYDDATLLRAMAVGDFLSDCYEANEGAGDFSGEELIELIKIAFPNLDGQ